MLIYLKTDTKEWEREIEEKSMIDLYKEYKEKMGYEGCYNNENSRMLIRARSNTLKLKSGMKGWANRRRGDATYVGKGDEDMGHYIKM